MLILRQSTSVDFLMGPFLDLVAGTTEEGLTITSSEVRLSKNGGNLGAKSESTNMVHDESGMYLLKLNTTDTATVGSLVIIVDDTANLAIPVSGEYQVVEEAVYDALYVSAADAFTSDGEVSLKAATQASIAAIETDTGTTLDGKINTIDSLVDSIVAEVVTAQSHPAQGQPATSINIADAIMWLLKLAVNKKTQTATQMSLYNSDEATVDSKATISETAGTLTYGELKTGP